MSFLPSCSRTTTLEAQYQSVKQDDGVCIDISACLCVFACVRIYLCVCLRLCMCCLLCGLCGLGLADCLILWGLCVCEAVFFPCAYCLLPRFMMLYGCRAKQGRIVHRCPRTAAYSSGTLGRIPDTAGRQSEDIRHIP